MGVAGVAGVMGRRGSRLECLDGLRGVLAVYVLLGHMAPFAVLPDWVQAALSHGGAAVDVFFMLSGLVISQSLGHGDGRATVFLINRVARIFPVFLVVFAVAVVVRPWSCGFEFMPWIGDASAARHICAEGWPGAWMAEIVAHLTMTHGLFPAWVLPDAWVSFLGAAWSLSTEWQFYLLALLTVNLGRRLWLILLGLGVAGVLWGWSMPEAWQFSRAFLPNKAQFFALGVASVPLLAEGDGALGRYGMALAACLVICAMQGSFGTLLAPLIWTGCLAVQSRSGSLVARSRPVAFGWRVAAGVLRGRVAGYLGSISYCLYLVNEPIHKMLGEALGRLAGGDGTLFSVLWITLSIGLPVLVAGWLHVYLEAPALACGRALALRLAAKRAMQTA